MSCDMQFVFESRAVRVVLAGDGAPWWVGSEVCAAIGIVDHRHALARLDADERGWVKLHTLGGLQSVATVNEPGLYRLIFSSRKPAAERFKRWLAHEVLPSLRRTGRYRMRPEADTPTSADLPVDAEGWLSLVREARLTYGRAAAARVWSQSPLPMPSAKPEEFSETDAMCLDFIAECCHVTGEEQHFTTSGQMRDAARQYCRDAVRPFPGPRSFANAMTRLVASGAVPGASRVKRSDTGYNGILLVAPNPSPGLAG